MVLGRDYAGVVEQAGAAVTRYRAGDEVYGFIPGLNPTVHDGSWAELVVVPQDRMVARRPAGVDARQAGVAPVAALTAHDAMGLGPGDTVLVVGASGGVGGFAAQLAARAGATVVAPGLPEDEEYPRALGVVEVLDLVSQAPDALNAYAAVVRDGGRVVSSIGAAGEDPGRANVGGDPSTENLERLARLLEDGTLAVHVQAGYPLAQAGQALADLTTRHTQGKLAIDLL